MRIISSGVVVFILAVACWAQLPTNATAPSSSNASPPALASTGSVAFPNATPSPPKPPQKWEPPFWLNTLITIVISALTALIATWFKDRERKRDLLEREFLDAIKELRTLCDTACQQVVTHLIAEPFAVKRQRQSHTTILMQLKLCASRVERGMGLLHEADRNQLEAEFLKWKAALTGSPFPVLKSDCACQPHDQPVSQVHAAHGHWSQYLDRLTRDCMNGSLKIAPGPKS